MQVLLTGATGFVGRHVAEDLRSAGHDVRCLVRSRARAEPLAQLGCTVVQGDVTDPAGLADAVAGVEAVVHVAGLIAARSAREMLRVNAEGTARLASCAVRSRTPVRRFLLVSSLAAAGPSADGLSEESPARPVSLYGLSKLRGEQEAARALQGAAELVVVRPPAVYGPHDRGILDLFRVAARGVRLRIGSRPRPISIVHGADLARGIRLALEAPVAAGRTYYVANPGARTIERVLEMIAASLGSGGPVRGVSVRLPDAAVRLAGVVAEEVARLLGNVPTFSRDKAREFLAPGWVCSSARAERELGWTPLLRLEDGLAATAAWYRENGWL